MEKATFAAGCFWGVEETFRHLKGVISTTVGYTGGHTENPTYEQVCGKKTGHAEAVEVMFDPSIISYEDLLEVFWNCHDPTQLNRQGWDIGTQYRSAIFYHDEKQKKKAEESLQKKEAEHAFPRPIATEITPASTFYKAEEYHQKYLEKHGRGHCKVYIPRK